MTQYVTSCMTQNVGAIFWQKKAKKGCMTQKCMTQNVRPKWQYNLKTVQGHDVAPSLCCTTIYIDSPHMSRDGAGKLILPFYLM